MEISDISSQNEKSTSRKLGSRVIGCLTLSTHFTLYCHKCNATREVLQFSTEIYKWTIYPNLVTRTRVSICKEKSSIQQIQSPSRSRSDRSRTTVCSQQISKQTRIYCIYQRFSTIRK